MTLDQQEQADVLQALDILNRVVDRNIKGATALYVKLALSVVANALISKK